MKIQSAATILPLAAALALFYLTPAQGQVSSASRLMGHWEGAFVRDGSVQFIELDFSEDSTLSGEYSIPRIGLYDQALSEISLQSSHLTFRTIYGPFECTIHNRLHEITGVNGRWNPPVRLHLKKALAKPKPSKRKVIFKSGDIRLCGTLFTPTTKGPHPAIVVVGGSAQNVDEMWEFRSKAELLSRHGIAALIYDKRGYGESSGDTLTMTYQDLASDVVSAVGFLRSQEDTDSENVGLIGSSQGGWISLEASIQLPDLSYLVLCAGPAVDVWTQELHRVEYSMRAEGFDEVDISAAIKHSEAIFSAALDESQWTTVEKSAAMARQTNWAEFVSLPDSFQQIVGWNNEVSNPAPIIRNLKTPTLAFFAEHDLLVPPTENVQLMQSYLEEAGNNDFQIVVVNGATHSMSTYHELLGDEWEWPTNYWSWSGISPEFSQTMIDWVRKRSGI